LDIGRWQGSGVVEDGRRSFDASSLVVPGSRPTIRYRRRRMADQTPSDEEFAPLTQDEQEVIMQVVRLLRKLRFGTVLLVVQDGKVVQIEMAEKIRLR
jgi:hypothetical protein